MSHFRSVFIAAILIGAAGFLSEANAQTPAPRDSALRATTKKVKEERQKEAVEWKQKQQSYQAEQAVVQKKRTDCKMQARAKKLHFNKRTLFMADCMAQ